MCSWYQIANCELSLHPSLQMNERIAPSRGAKYRMKISLPVPWYRMKYSSQQGSRYYCCRMEFSSQGRGAVILSKFSSHCPHVQIPQNHSNSIIVGLADSCCRPWCLQQVSKFSSERFHVQIPQNHSNSIIVGPTDPCCRPWCLQQVSKFSSERFHVQIPQNHSNSIIVGPTDPCCRPWCFHKVLRAGHRATRKNERGAERGMQGVQVMSP